MTFLQSNTFPSGTRTINNLMTGGTFTMGSAGKTITLGDVDGQGKTLIFAGNAASTTIVNSAFQDPPSATPGSTGATISITGTGTVQLNGLSTYTGGTTGGISINAGGGTNLGTWPAGFVPGTNISGGGVTVQIGSSSNGLPGSFTAGPFGVAPIYLNNGTTNPVFQPIGADQTVANDINLNSGVIASQATGNPFSLTFTGPVTLNANRTLTSNIPAPQAEVFNGVITLGTTAAQTLTLAGSGVYVFNGAIQKPAGLSGGAVTISNTGMTSLNGNNTFDGTLTISGAGSTVNVTGTNTSATLTISGAGSTVNLTKANAFSTLTVSGAGSAVTGLAQASGSPFGAATVAITLTTTNLQLNGIASATTTAVGTVTFSGGTNLIIDNTTGGGAATTTIAGGNLARTGTGTLLITPVTGCWDQRGHHLRQWQHPS